mgnify:CR=1 FL=1
MRKEIGDERGRAYVLCNIGVIYDEQESYDKSVEYYRQALQINQKIEDHKAMAGVLNNLGEVLFAQELYDSAMYYYKKSLSICNNREIEEIYPQVINNIGGVYFKQKDYNKALNYYRLSLVHAEEADDYQSIVSIKNSIGKVLVLLGKKDEALKVYFESLRLSESAGLKEDMKVNYREIAALFASMDNYSEAYKYSRLFSIVSDSLYSENNMKKLADVRVKYETEKKEKEIQLLTQEAKLQDLQLNRNRLITIIASIASVFILMFLIILFIAFRTRQKNKELLLKQQADEAIRHSEKRMLSKVIETEEKERERFARDLHDGLGPLLSSIKLYANELAADDMESGEKESMLKYTNDLLDEAVKSTRAISNNLIPTIISDYGLYKAIKSFCDKLNLASNLQISLEKNFDQRLPVALEIVFYRVIQELLNNTVKYAEATSVNIQLKKENNTAGILYEDNGKGFNLDEVMAGPKSGMGIKNIQSRINSVDGNCKFITSNNNGLKVEIDVPLNYFNDTYGTKS